MISTILQSERRRRIWLYFLDLRIRYALVVLFVGLALADWSLGKSFLLLGFAWLGGALVLDRTRPSDREFDELLSRDVESLMEKAERILEPGEHEMRAEPLGLRGPIERDVAACHRYFTKPRTGRDGGRRSPMNRVVFLWPMEDRLCTYSCHHDSLTDLTSQISVEEHHYRDVVSVTLEEDVEAAHVGKTKNGASPTQIFSLEFTSGRRLSIAVSVGPPVDGTGEGEPRRTELDKTVRALQALIRDKR